MTRVLVTGSAGFVGKNLLEALRSRSEVSVLEFDSGQTTTELRALAVKADFVIHLAGVNRPEDSEDFETANVGLTAELVGSLEATGRRVPVVFSSSIQAQLDTPYGRSKYGAEELLKGYSLRTGAGVATFRLPNVFGRWCRPNYNSVVATFCHNITRGLPIAISDPCRQLELVYIDDVVRAFLDTLVSAAPNGYEQRPLPRTHQITLGELAELLRQFRDSRSSLVLPAFGNQLTRALYATYLSYLPKDQFAFSLSQREDARGVLAEFMKSEAFGQIFVSRTRPGVIRGNHYHLTKTERFLVLDGETVIRFRHILGGEVISYPVSGHEFKVVDIPPGYAHSIQNTGQTEAIVLFWASEPFDPAAPDTYSCEVNCA